MLTYNNSGDDSKQLKREGRWFCKALVVLLLLLRRGFSQWALVLQKNDSTRLKDAGSGLQSDHTTLCSAHIMLMKFTIHTSQNWAGSVSTAWLITHPICLWCSSGSQSAWCIIHLIVLEWLYNHQAIKTRGPEIMGTGLSRTSPSVLMSRRIMVFGGEWGLRKNSNWKWKQPQMQTGIDNFVVIDFIKLVLKHGNTVRDNITTFWSIIILYTVTTLWDCTTW